MNKIILVLALLFCFFSDAGYFKEYTDERGTKEVWIWDLEDFPISLCLNKYFSDHTKSLWYKVINEMENEYQRYMINYLYPRDRRNLTEEHERLLEKIPHKLFKVEDDCHYYYIQGTELDITPRDTITKQMLAKTNIVAGLTTPIEDRILFGLIRIGIKRVLVVLNSDIEFNREWEKKERKK